MAEKTDVEAPESYAVSVEDALSRLVVVENYDNGSGPQPCVHTYRTGTGLMLGAHWTVRKAEEAFRAHGVGQAEPGMTGMGHGLVVIDETGPVFFESRPKEES